jgi:hypothetical protein
MFGREVVTRIFPRASWFLIFVAFLSVAASRIEAATIVVPSGGDFQAALNQAQPGDIIVLQAGATYIGNFLLPNKSGSSFISIQSSAPLPLERISPASVGLLAKIQAPNSDSVIKTTPGSHHYSFLGVEVSTTTSALAGHTLVELGDSAQTSLADVPHHIVFDRCWIHGFATQEVQRGVALNGAELTITNSYISNIHGNGYDTQAIAGWAGPGPFHILNNYLEASGENVMFGGADPKIANLVPSDIEVRNNTFFKPLSWKSTDPSYAGIHWSVKNLFELKNARRVIIDANTFENNWVDAQAGWAIQFTVRNQDGTAPWSTLQDITFTNNVVRNSPQGVNLLGLDNLQTSQRASGLNLSNNLFSRISGTFLTIQGYYNVSLKHNTHLQAGNIMTMYGDPSLGFVANDNLTIRENTGYGIKGDATGEGTIALTTFAPGFVFQKNAVALANATIYPLGDFYPTQITQIGFTDYANGDYRLLSTSPYHNAATDGKDLGVDFSTLATYGTASPSPTPTPIPSPSPTPTVTPSPTPTATPSATPTATPTPSPTPSATPTPSPSPTPTATPTPTPTASPTPTPAPGSLGKRVGQLKKNGQTLSNQLASATSLSDSPGASAPVAGQSTESLLTQFVSDIQQTYLAFNNERGSYPAAERIEVALNDAYTEGILASQSAQNEDIAAVRDHLRKTLGSLELSDVLVNYGDITNPIDVPSFMVRQHYVDFLDREPDQSGNDFWINEVLKCGADTECVDVKRINVSSAFFLSIEFQQTGYYLYRLYRSSFGNAPRLAEFTADNESVSGGVIVGKQGWETRLAANKQAFVAQWIQRPAFQTRYGGLSNDQFVDALILNVGLPLTGAERNELVQHLVAGASRAAVLNELVNLPAVSRGQFNSAFVLMQYFGYLGRDPDSEGYNFWLHKLDQFNGDYVAAEMVKAFLNSAEYRRRFGK